jgi:flagellar motor switch protein FliM
MRRMRKVIVFVGMLALGACSKGKFEQALSEMSDLKDKMCACTDKACADKVQEDFRSFRKSMKDRFTKDELKNLSKEDDKKGRELQSGMDECRRKFADTSSTTGSAAPAPAPATP